MPRAINALTYILDDIETFVTAVKDEYLTKDE
jgi:hypothetical protein